MYILIENNMNFKKERREKRDVRKGTNPEKSFLSRSVCAGFFRWVSVSVSVSVWEWALATFLPSMLASLISVCSVF